MFPQSNRSQISSYLSSQVQPIVQKHTQRKSKYLLTLVILVAFTTNIPKVAAHQVKVAADVGGTLHIEPNDNPRAGESTQAWFALTRKGGKAIPLTQCNCRLAVYAEPHSPKEPPLLEPALKSVTAERYQGVPGAELTFPKPGLYQLQLKGKPASGASFKPFDFKFEVTVAAGTAGNTQNVQNLNSDVVQSESKQFPLWAIAIPIIAAAGILFAVLQGRRS